MNHWLSKLANTFILALVEEKLSPLNALYFSTQISPKSLVKQSKTAKKCLHFTDEYFTMSFGRIESSGENNKIKSVAFKAR